MEGFEGRKKKVTQMPMRLGSRLHGRTWGSTFLRKQEQKVYFYHLLLVQYCI